MIEPYRLLPFLPDFSSFFHFSLFFSIFSLFFLISPPPSFSSFFSRFLVFFNFFSCQWGHSVPLATVLALPLVKYGSMVQWFISSNHHKSYNNKCNINHMREQMLDEDPVKRELEAWSAESSA